MHFCSYVAILSGFEVSIAEILVLYDDDPVPIIIPLQYNYQNHYTHVHKNIMLKCVSQLAYLSLLKEKLSIICQGL